MEKAHNNIAKKSESVFSLRDWQTKFKNEHNSEWKSIVERAKQRSSDNKQSAPFVEVRLDESTASDLEVEERSSAWEISTPGGFKITMPADSNISEVVALIRRLRRHNVKYTAVSKSVYILATS